MSSFPAPPNPIKRKRTQCDNHPNTNGTPAAVISTPAKRKRESVAKAEKSSAVDGRGKGKRKKADVVVNEHDASDQVVAVTTNDIELSSGGEGGMSKSLLNQITYGTTRKQRHWVLEQMIKAVKNLQSCHEDVTVENELRCYFSRVEQRLYTGVFGKQLNASYNLYRANLYRKLAFEIIYALRANGIPLMKKYEPELLASLPAPYLAEGTRAGEQYRVWKEERQHQRDYEEQFRQAKKETKGEGWLRCPRCGGKFDVSELQMRGGDEPATIFRTCQNCGFTKRNG